MSIATATATAVAKGVAKDVLYLSVRWRINLAVAIAKAAKSDTAKFHQVAVCLSRLYWTFRHCLPLHIYILYITSGITYFSGIEYIVGKYHKDNY